MEPQTRYSIHEMMENLFDELNHKHKKDKTKMNICLTSNNLVISKDEEFVIGVIGEGSIVFHFIMFEYIICCNRTYVLYIAVTYVCRV